MTRKSILLFSLLYLVAALAFAAIIELTNPVAFNGNHELAALIGRIVGGGVEAYVVPGLLPMIAWGIMRFRLEKAAGPFIAWWLLGIVLAELSWTGTFYDRR